MKSSFSAVVDVLVLLLMIITQLARSQDILANFGGSAFRNDLKCGSSHESKGKWCSEQDKSRWMICGADPENNNSQLSSEPVVIPDNLDEFILSLKFSISSCDDLSNSLGSKVCSEQLRTEVFGLKAQFSYPSTERIPLFSQTETSALGTSLIENYPIRNQPGVKYVVVKFTAGSSCVTVENIAIKAETCPTEVSDLVRFSSAFSSETAKYEGVCVDNAVLNGNHKPMKKCSHGRWLRYADASCLCDRGYYFSSNQCAACPKNQFKSSHGNHQCSRCPPFSTSDTGAHNCSCVPGYFHDPNSVDNPACYKLPSAPQVWQVYNDSDRVHLNWSSSGYDSSIQVRVSCDSCVDLVPKVEYNPNSAVISGLDESTEYVFRVAAVNQVSSLNPESTVTLVTAKTKKSRKVRNAQCIHNFDQLKIEWSPSEVPQYSSTYPGGDSHLGQSATKLHSQYMVKIRADHSLNSMEYYTNETTFQLSHLEANVIYSFQIGLKNDPDSFTDESLCTSQGPILTKAQIQGITILVGIISIVFVFLLTILFLVFCYYKKKRDEYFYSSCGRTFDAADIKNLSPLYINNAGRYYMASSANQYHMGDVHSSPKQRFQNVPMGAMNYSKSGLLPELDSKFLTTEANSIPLSCTGVDLFLEASQYYETYESLLLDYAREIPYPAVTIENPGTSNAGSAIDLSGIFAPGIVFGKGTLLVDEKENKCESVRLMTLTEKASEDDHKILAMQIMNMSHFTHPNVLLMHGVILSHTPLTCVLEDPSFGPLSSVLSQMMTLAKNYYINQSNCSRSDYMKLSLVTTANDSPCNESSNKDMRNSNTSPSSGNSSASTYSNYSKIGSHGVDVPELLHLLRGIASGMQYLHDGGIYVHKVLCSMNVFVNRNKMCKIGGFDMRASLDLHSYNAMTSNATATPNTTPAPTSPFSKLIEIQNILAPWTALEVFDGSSFSQSSDVWSFGTIVWHVFSLGQTPYFDWNRKEILRMLYSGYRLPPPDSCPDSVYELMMYCWSLSPQMRPNFTFIRECLEKLICNSPNFSFTATHSSDLSPSSLQSTRYPRSNFESVEKFLYNIGMRHYQSLFDTAGISKIDELATLNNRTLKDMGVKMSKDRKIILGAVANSIGQRPHCFTPATPIVSTLQRVL